MRNTFKKYITIIFVIAFIALFSFFQGRDYLDFYKQSQELRQEESTIKQKLSSFSLEKVREFKSLDFYYSPYKPLLDELVEKINNAKTRVYVEVYMFTEKRIRQALVNASKRGVDIKVVLEKNPYRAYNINNKSYDILKQEGIAVVWSNPKNFSLNHSKILIIDDELIISTGNLTYSTFAYNRDLFLFIKDKVFLEKALKIFNADFSGEIIYIYDDNLLLSPSYSRVKMNIIFSQAKKMDMYFPYLKDDKLFSLLISRLKEGLQLRLIVSNNSIEDMSPKIKELKKAGATVKIQKKLKLHAKALLIDDKYLLVGSINFSKYSLDNNREIGVILKNKDIINKFKKVFEMDFKKE